MPGFMAGLFVFRNQQGLAIEALQYAMRLSPLESPGCFPGVAINATVAGPDRLPMPAVCHCAPPPSGNSIATFWPSTKPASLKPLL
jgi:hypothetical protein